MVNQGAGSIPKLAKSGDRNCQLFPKSIGKLFKGRKLHILRMILNS